MNPNRRILANSTLLAAARLVDRASRMVLALVIARILHADGLGIYTAAIVYYELIVIASETGSSTFLVREIGRDGSKTSTYLTHLSVIAIAASTVLVSAFLVVIPHLHFKYDMGVALRIIAVAVVPGVLNTIQEAVFIAHQRMKFATYTTLVAAAAHMVVSLSLLLTGRGILALIITFVAFQYGIMFVYAYFIGRYIAPLTWQFDLKFIITILRDVKTFAVLAILSGLFSRPEVIILSLLSSVAQVGFYSAALRVINIWQLIPRIYMMNVFPVISRDFKQGDVNAYRLVNNSIRYLLALSLPVMVGIIVAADPIIKLLFGSGFRASVTPLRLLAMDIPLQALSAVLWRVLVARGQEKIVLRALALNTIAELVGGYALISGWQSLGAAIISPTIFLTYVISLAVYAKKSGSDLRITSPSWRFAIAAFAMGAFIVPFAHDLPLWTLVAIGCVLYITVATLIRAFSANDLAFIRKTLPLARGA